MKKPRSIILALVLVVGSFLLGTWYNQRGADQKNTTSGGRRILHYVDPMNPAHTSDKPGIAPCGMPMEPVFSDDESSGPGSPVSAASMSPGTVRINPQKQQLIGVQTGKVEVQSETHPVRALGRVVADENAVYRLIAATDGWMSDINESTTGSLVRKDQVMAQIRVYSYDFYSWQQRFITELRNRGRRRPPAATVARPAQAGALPYGVPPLPIKPQPGTTQHWEFKPPSPRPISPQSGPEVSGAQQPASPQSGASRPPSKQPWGIPPGASSYGVTPPESPEPWVAPPPTLQPMPPQPGAQSPAMQQAATPQTSVAQPRTKQPSGIPPGATQYGVTRPESPEPWVAPPPITQAMPPQPGAQSPAMQQPATSQTAEPLSDSMQPGAMPSAAVSHGQKPSPDHQHDAHQGEIPEKGTHQREGMEHGEGEPGRNLSMHAGNASKPDITAFDFMGEDDIYYADKGRLDLLGVGVSKTQLEDIAETGKYVTHVELRSPVDGLVLARKVSPQQRVDKGTEVFTVADLKRVWIVAEVFPIEAQYIKPGMRARIALPQQNQIFQATVTDVPAVFDATTRTLKVRLEVENPDLVLRPEMFVDVEFLITFPPAITVPADAVLDSGRRKTVFVAHENGFFEPRSVMTGWRFGDRVEIVEGLMPDEQIVISGNFLIDSESRMKLAAAGLYGIPERDPICGQDVYPARAKAAGLISESGGKMHYFFTKDCKDQFDREHGLMSDVPSGGSAQNIKPGGTGDNLAAHGFAKDVVCGMPIPQNKAKAAGLTTEHAGQSYYFCSEECKQHFDKAPEPIVERAQRRATQSSAPQTVGHKHD
jgi:YHS domain-containing protein